MVLIEGMTVDELLALPPGEFQVLVLSGKVVTFRAGTAEIMGRFGRESDRLRIELAHIDGGGEGVLPTIASIATKIARREGLGQIEWIVHALNCSQPNPKLQAFLRKRGFVVRSVPDIGEAYHLVAAVAESE